MANTISGNTRLNLQYNEQVSTGVIQPYSITGGGQSITTYTNGTGPNQINLMYSVQLTLTAAPQTLDLTALTDLTGAAIDFARVREFWVQNTSLVSPVTVEGGASNPWVGMFNSTAAMTVQPSASLYQNDPISSGSGIGAVVTGGSKTVKIDPGSATVIVNVFFAGGTAA